MDELDGGQAFQEAILTSDTCTKSCSAKIETASGTVITVGGVVKGAGMIQPNMATMLAFLCTDASASPAFLQKHLSAAVDQSFNRITIDGDMSTNDSVILLANGSTEIDIEKEPAKIQAEFIEAVQRVCACLARKCVSDGEKVTKFVRVLVEGATDQESAEQVARAIANSLLVKSSWYGSDPNWGRIVDAAGYAKVGIQFHLLDLYYNEVPALRKGEPLVANKAQWKEVVSAESFLIRLNLNMGNSSEEIWSNDLSEAYVNFNKSE
jgi:glutamate N-acetyltransferase/amino-acid N-acetyltransferase